MTFKHTWIEPNITKKTIGPQIAIKFKIAEENHEATHENPS